MIPRPTAPVSVSAALSIAIALALSVPLATAQDRAEPPRLFDRDRTPTLSAADPALAFEYYASGALRAYPGLAAALMAEAGAAGAKAASDARADQVERVADGVDWRSHTLALYDTVPFADAGVVSVIRATYVDTGGAHPNRDLETWLWRTADGARVSLGDLFSTGRPPPGFAAAWAEALVAEKVARLGSDPAIAAEAEATAAQFAARLASVPFTLYPSTEPGFAAGIMLHHPPYAVGSYAEGEYHVLVPAARFEDALTPEAAALFRGAPEFR